MNKSSTKWFIIILATALLIGGLVLVFKPDYRPDKILESNKEYYPDYKVCE